MIINTKTCLLLAGTIGKTPELKFVGQNERPVLKFSLRYGSEEDGTGKRRGKFVDVDVWSGAEEFHRVFHHKRVRFTYKISLFACGEFNR